MIVTYNKEQVGDVLMLTLKNSGDAKLAVERKGKVARVYREDKQETVAWNIFEASTFFALEGKGQLFLSDEQVARLNQELQAEDLQRSWSMTRSLSLSWGKSLKWLLIQIVTTSTSAKWLLDQTRRFRS